MHFHRSTRAARQNSVITELVDALSELGREGGRDCEADDRGRTIHARCYCERGREFVLLVSHSLRRLIVLRRLTCDENKRSTWYALSLSASAFEGPSEEKYIYIYVYTYISRVFRFLACAATIRYLYGGARSFLRCPKFYYASYPYYGSVRLSSSSLQRIFRASLNLSGSRESISLPFGFVRSSRDCGPAFIRAQ